MVVGFDLLGANARTLVVKRGLVFRDYLRRNPLVRLDQPAEMFLTVDLTEFDRLEFWRRLSTTVRQIFSRAVRSMFVVIINEFRNKIIEMHLAESDEMVQGFVFNRLHKPLDPGIQIGRADRQSLRLDAFVL